MKQLNSITRVLDTGLITSEVITGVISIEYITNGFGLHVRIGSGGANVLLSLSISITQRSLKMYNVNQGKPDAISY